MILYAQKKRYQKNRVDKNEFVFEKVIVPLVTFSSFQKVYFSV